MSRTFTEAFELMLKIQAPKSKNTLAQAKCVVKHLQPWFEVNCPNLEEFENDFEERWAEYRAAQAKIPRKNGKARRLGHDRRYLVMALRRALAKNWIKKPFKKSDFALNDAMEPIGKYVEDSDIKKLLAALEGHPKTKLQVLMAVLMGMRLSEILKLRKEEVNLTRRQIVLDPNRLKTRKPRKVPIPIANDVLPLLKAAFDSATGIYVFPMDRNPDEPQADNRHWWSAARRKAGVACRFHDLRHTAITNAIAAKIPSEWVTQVFGATPAVISRVYAHLREDDQEQFRSFNDGRFTVSK